MKYHQERGNEVMVIFPSGFWKELLEKAARVGLKGNRILLVVLVVAATIWVSIGAGPWVCVTFVLLVYSTHQGWEFAKEYLRKLANQPKLTLKKSRYSAFVLTRQQQRSKQEPPASNRCKAPRRLPVKRSDDTRAT